MYLQTPLEISEALNSHFASVGSSYSESFKEKFVLLPDLFPSVIPSLYFDPTYSQEILSIINDKKIRILH